MNFDEPTLFYSRQRLLQGSSADDDNEDMDVGVDEDEESPVDLGAVRRHFREFLRNYRLSTQRYLYRDRLLKMHRRLMNSNKYSSGQLEVDLAHLGEYDASLLGFLMSQPANLLPSMEEGARDALESLLYDKQAQTSTATNHDDDDVGGAEDNHDENQTPNVVQETASLTTAGLQVQILLKGNLKTTSLRSIKSEHMHKLLKCPGICISASPVRCRAVELKIRCPKCQDERSVTNTDGPYSTIHLPQTCSGTDPKECGSYPYNVVPDESRFVDQQTLKLQELPESVPTGEMPRSVLLAAERNLVDKAPPGTRMSVICIPTLFAKTTQGRGDASSGMKFVYLRVVGMIREDTAHGSAPTFTPAEEEAFIKLSKRPDVYSILSRSMAPSISGSYTVDIKRALLCQLMGGSHKRLPDGIKLRGDINVLMLGDPSTAKSQFLKFVSRVAPIGIYTSGKGSSAAGLTASVVRDSKGEFYLEGGAMVLADGGVVCIDEFDKMRPNDRVAIHEAMEQQTISIAKAGITTVLNTRSSVLAAANPIFGRYDDFKSAADQIDLMTTILSRFDLIFLVRDIRNAERDRMICQHVMGVHMGAAMNSGGTGGMDNPFGPSKDADSTEDNSPFVTEANHNVAENVMRIATTGNGELDVPSMKKYIQYCKTKCQPRLTEEAGEVLQSSYVKIRDDIRNQSAPSTGRGTVGDSGGQATIPITVRQLEALVRVAESLAKMRLDPEVKSEDINEALRLFQVSTMTANAADQNLTQLGGGNAEELARTEDFLRSRLGLGSSVNKQKLLEEAAAQGHNAMVASRCFSVMVMRGELLERNQGRLLKRIK